MSSTGARSWATSPCSIWTSSRHCGRNTRRDQKRGEGVSMSGLTAFTWFHTALSLVQLVSGIIVVIELMGSRDSKPWFLIYLVSAIATSVTGFLFPVDKFLPSHAFGIASLILLLFVILARYKFHLVGAWRLVYVIALVITVYLDAFVAIAQAFLKIPPLHALAPGGSEPPFAIAQGVLLVVTIWLGIVAARNFQPSAATSA